MRNRITIGARVDPLLGAVLAFLGAAIANVARDVVRVGVAPLHEVAIAGLLIAIGRSLIVVGHRLVAIGRRLISFRERLIAIRKRLIIPERL